jgi:hypothetical protein
MGGDDAAGVRQFARTLAEKVNLVLGSQLDGPFAVIRYPGGFPYFWQFGGNNYYNEATLETVDQLASIDSNGVCGFTGDSFSRLYLRVLRNVQFAVSESDTGKISEVAVTSSQDILAKATLHTSSPSADNGGAPLSETMYHVPFRGFRPIEEIQGSLDDANNSLPLSWEVNNLSSPVQSMSIVDGKVAGPASSNIVMVNFSDRDQQALSLRKVSGSASKVEISITYPGLTIIQSQPVPLKADLTTGWYENEILTQVVQKAGTSDTGFHLTGTEYSVPDLFGRGKRFGRVKTFVVSKEPTITITFYDADPSALQDKYQQGKSISLSLAGTFNFGLGGSGLKVQSVDSDATGKTVVTIAPPAKGPTLPQDQTAHILGGVMDYPPGIVIRPQPGSISVKNSGAFTASFSIEYKQDGKIRTDESGQFNLSVSKRLLLPADAAEVLLTVQIVIWPLPEKCSVLATYHFATPVTKSFELNGTTMNPVCKEV